MNKSLWPLPLLLFGVLLLPNLFSHGLFMDGNIYAAISRNMSIGFGSFWDPSLSDTLGNSFHEHPPLAFGLQSNFFYLVGDHFWVERLYSIFVLGGHLSLIWAFWKLVFPSSKNWIWLIFLLYALVPTVSWSFTNNMLENTMVLFSGLAVYILLRNRQALDWKAVSLASIFIVCAFHTKGPVSLFPLATPFFIWISYREISFAKMMWTSLLLVAISVGLFCLIYYRSEGAAESWNLYYAKQVYGTFTAENPVFGVRRTYILERLLIKLTIPILIALGYLFYSRNKKIAINFKTSHLWFFGLIGLSAVLPIMVSPKQSSFYALPAMLYLVIGIGIIIVQIAHKTGPLLPTKFFGPIKKMALLGFFGVFVYSIASFGELSRDKGKLSGVMEICEMFPERTIFSADLDLFEDYNISTYFVRYKSISLDFTNTSREYYLGTVNSKMSDSYEVVYEKEGELLMLYKKNDSYEDE